MSHYLSLPVSLADRCDVCAAANATVECPARESAPYWKSGLGLVLFLALARFVVRAH
ncbi:GH11946 [Drosophila grimshawi]|uniref:GH11946 n=1 Tax=Drosophila grimshawi TaxID=7222 RepID=B4K1E3_DROGR|nr:GH11946 [Drosophila grimshawi]